MAQPAPARHRRAVARRRHFSLEDRNAQWRRFGDGCVIRPRQTIPLRIDNLALTARTPSACDAPLNTLGVTRVFAADEVVEVP